MTTTAPSLTEIADELCRSLSGYFAASTWNKGGNPRVYIRHSSPRVQTDYGYVEITGRGLIAHTKPDTSGTRRAIVSAIKEVEGSALLVERAVAVMVDAGGYGPFETHSGGALAPSDVEPGTILRRTERLGGKSKYLVCIVEEDGRGWVEAPHRATKRAGVVQILFPFGSVTIGEQGEVAAEEPAKRVPSRRKANAPVVPGTPDELLAERATLAARIAEIDALLAPQAEAVL